MAQWKLLRKYNILCSQSFAFQNNPQVNRWQQVEGEAELHSTYLEIMKGQVGNWRGKKGRDLWALLALRYVTFKQDLLHVSIRYNNFKIIQSVKSRYAESLTSHL